MTQTGIKDQSSKKKTNFPGLFKILVFILLLGICGWGYNYYQTFFRPNVITGNKSSTYIYIHTGADFNSLENQLSTEHYLRDIKSFSFVAQKKKYDRKVRPGRYKISDGMNNNELINLLRSGKQEPVRVIVQNVRTPEELSGKISEQIEGDSISIISLLHNQDYLSEFGIGPATVFSLFIPNTYEFFWNTSADQFIRRMVKERQKFWNDQRITQMSQEGLDIPGVITLASIVEKETVKNSEKPVIAGVYLNRLRKGWPLQADPTLIFAWNDFTIKRVLNKHKEINSPYNTYKHTGLPPGPICLPSVSSIDAVLNYDHNPFMYFCAKDDLSGYHQFSVTLAEHNRNAERYQTSLKRMNIH